MRNFVVVGASALVLALGVAQASAAQFTNVNFDALGTTVPSTAQPWAEYVNRTEAQQEQAPSYVGELGGFHAQATDQAFTAPIRTFSSRNH
jgi:hypothetical protein